MCGQPATNRSTYPGKIRQISTYISVMKFPLIVLFAIGILQSVYAQNDADIENLRETFGHEKVDWLIESQPDHASFLAYRNSHGYYAADVPDEKEVTFSGHISEIEPLYPQLPAVTDQLIESGQWGMLGYALDESPSNSYYSMGNGRMLVVLPESLVRRLFEQNKSK